jgi:elongation factor Ts
VSPDGRTVVVTNYNKQGAGPQKTLSVIALPGGDTIKTIDLGEYRAPHDIRWVDQARVVITVEGSQALLVVNITSGQVERVFKTEQAVSLLRDRYARFGGSGAVGAYVHHNAKVGTLVEIAGLTGEAGQQLARTIAEHVTAGVPTVPVAVTRDDVPAALVERERRIFTEQAAGSGKPANIVEKMVQGRVDKFYKEITLLDQPWVRDDSKAIRDLVKAAGAGVSIRRFARFQIGQE